MTAMIRLEHPCPGDVHAMMHAMVGVLIETPHRVELGALNEGSDVWERGTDLKDVNGWLMDGADHCATCVDDVADLHATSKLSL